MMIISLAIILITEPQKQDSTKIIDSLSIDNSFNGITSDFADSTDNFFKDYNHNEEQHLVEIRVGIGNLIDKLKIIKFKIDSIKSTKIDTIRR